jgi:anti-anti-sigma regulatory factor
MENSFHLVRFEGDLDISRYPEIRSAFETVPHAVPVLVDLTRVDSVDSTFLTEMLLFKRRHSAKLAVLIRSVGHVARIFEIANLNAKVDVYVDRPTALDALDPAPAPSAHAPELAPD